MLQFSVWPEPAVELCALFHKQLLPYALKYASFLLTPYPNVYTVVTLPMPKDNPIRLHSKGNSWIHHLQSWEVGSPVGWGPSELLRSAGLGVQPSRRFEGRVHMCLADDKRYDHWVVTSQYPSAYTVPLKLSWSPQPVARGMFLSTVDFHF